MTGNCRLLLRFNKFTRENKTSGFFMGKEVRLFDPNKCSTQDVLMIIVQTEGPENKYSGNV